MKRPNLGETGFVSRILFVAGAILVAAVLVLIGVRVFYAKAPAPSAGFLDLRTWNFSTSGPVSLGGTWLFEPDRLVLASDFDKGAAVSRQVPDTRFSYPGKFFSGTGSGTYRLVVLLPPGGGRLALRYSTVWTSFEIEVNGDVVARVGNPWPSPELSEAGYRAGISRIEASGDRLEILVRVSNRDYRWGGIIQPLVLGDEVTLKAQKQYDDMLVFVVIGALFGVAGNALFLFSFRRGDRFYLYFASFALVSSLRALTSGDNLLFVVFPNLGFESFVRIEYGSIFLLIPAAALFFYRLFIEDYNRVELAWFVVPNFAFFLLVPSAPLLVLTWSLLPFLFVAVGLAVYGYVVFCLRPAMRRRPGAGILLAAGTVLLASLIANWNNEVLNARAENAFPYGLAAFVIAQSLVMAKRFTWAFDRTEALSKELKSANRRLMDEARAAEDARDLLETSVAEKDLLLREVHHRVRNSLQIVTSIINLQVRREKNPAAIAAYSSVRDRIRALSSVHERLFGLESEKKIDFPSYAKDLVRQFEESYADAGARLSLESDPVVVPMDLCIELGLVLTELVINAYRHAVIPAEGGTIQIALRRDGDDLVLTVTDEGPGFPEGFRPEEDSSVGFKIVSSLANHRGGRVTVSGGPGAVVSVRVPYEREGGPNAIAS